MRYLHAAYIFRYFADGAFRHAKQMPRITVVIGTADSYFEGLRAQLA